MPGIGTYILSSSPIKQSSIQVLKTGQNVNPINKSLIEIANPNTALNQKSQQINFTNQSVKDTVGTLYDIIV